MAPLAVITKQLISLVVVVPTFKRLLNRPSSLISTGLTRKMSSKKIIHTEKAPKAIGPYSQAVLVDKTLYISGQIGMDSRSGNLVEGGVTAQAKKALENMGHVLEAAGGNYGSVVKTTVLLADMNDFQAVNSVYTEFFKDKYPARAAYQVAALPKGGLVEIEAVAIISAANL